MKAPGAKVGNVPGVCGRRRGCCIVGGWILQGGEAVIEPAQGLDQGRVRAAVLVTGALQPPTSDQDSPTFTWLRKPFDIDELCSRVARMLAALRS